jgi:eukaryotic-like serine/threonine-protein kinase
MSSTGTTLEVPGYQVMEYLGSGARSTIWRVRDRKANEIFALKRVFKQPGDDNRYLDQADNEFEIASRFDHASLRKYYHIKRIRHWMQLTELHLVMELCDGQSCQANRPKDVPEVIRIFQDVASALGHMHSMGFVHGDMKPNNIIVGSKGGTVKVIDFGQSCHIGTRKTRIQGTPDFIAPEQVKLRPLDARTDIFNLGATIYWILVGRPIPTVLPKPTDTIQLISDVHVVPPHEINEKVPPSLSRLVLECIELRPSNRPNSMKDVLSRLDLINHTLSRATATPP